MTIDRQSRNDEPNFPERGRQIADEFMVFRALLELAGAPASSDARGCQSGILQELVDQSGAYFLAVKDQRHRLADQQQAFGLE